MESIFRINGNKEEFPEFDNFHDLTTKFMPYAHKKLRFDKPVEINLVSDVENSKNPLGKTAYYNPTELSITLFVDKRHLKDILRSLAHELVHHTQNCRGEFSHGIETEPGYAQNDEHMRKMEAEAYLEGSGFLLRDWEDSLKKENPKMEESNISEDTDVQEEVQEEGKKCPHCDGDAPESECICGEPEDKSTNENWAKGNKDQMLFETLVKKWTK